MHPSHVGLLVEPQHRFGRIFRHRENEFRIVFAVAAHDGLQREEFGRIEEILSAGGVVLGELLLDDLLQPGRLLRTSRTIRVLRDDVAHRGRHVEKFRGIGVHRGHVPFGTRRIAAQHRHLFENDHGRAVVDGRGGRHHPGAASAHDDDVGLRHEGRGVDLLGLDLFMEFPGIGPGLRERRLHALSQGVGRNRGARDRIDQHALVRDHFPGHSLGGERPDSRRFRMFDDLHVPDRRRVHGDFHRHVSVSGGNRRAVCPRRHGPGAAECGNTANERRDLRDFAPTHHCKLHF